MSFNIQSTIISQNKPVLIKELFNQLQVNSESCYEYYDTNEIKFIKVVVDIDIKKQLSKKIANEKYDDVDIINKTTETLKEMFGEDSNVIYTTDHRRYQLPKKTKKYYKKSFHFVIDNKKIKPSDLGSMMRKNKNKFQYKIDTSIYRNGVNKFRLPLTIKEPVLEIRTRNTKMITSLPETLDNFKKYCLTLTDGLEEIIIKVEEEEKKEEINEDINEDINEEEVVNSEWKICDLNYDKYNTILDKYKHDKIDKKTNTWICDIENPCPFGKSHDNNKRYLTLNFLTNSIYIKCHSENCKNKISMVMDNVFSDLKEFSLSIFMRLRDYNSQKKIFRKKSYLSIRYQ